MAKDAISFKFDVKEMINQYEWLGKFTDVARNPQVMDVGVKYLGRAIDHQFRSEGTPTMGGKWQQLSAMTNKLRSERGYPPAHPILQQSGELRDTTAGTLMAWNLGTGRAAVSGEGIRMAAWTGQLAFTAKASGMKMANHFGGKTESSYFPDYDQRGGEYSDLPARPFFGLTQAGTIQARDAITNKVMTDWKARSTKARSLK